jgi:hydroxymethylbilane synthase
VRLGTRGSALALTQARTVGAAIGDDVELVTISTSGDRGADAGVADKRRWIDAIEDALAAGEIDLAVHSAKDLPGAADLRAGMTVAATGAREEARDALVGATSIDALPPGARIGTSSLRRRAQLLAVRGDLEVVELRGNVDTRLRKLADGACDALVLAAAGLRRLGRDDAIGALLDLERFVPAPGQGLLALEGRAIPEALVDAAGQRSLALERAVVEALDASCDTPVGVHHDGTTLFSFVGLPDGSAWIRDQVTTTAGDAAALAVERLRTMGADELLVAAKAAMASSLGEHRGPEES